MSWDHSTSINAMSNLTIDGNDDTNNDATGGVQVDTQGNINGNPPTGTSAAIRSASNSQSIPPRDCLKSSRYADPASATTSSSSAPPSNKMFQGNKGKAAPFTPKYDSFDNKVMRLVNEELLRRMEQDVIRTVGQLPEDECAESQYTDFLKFVGLINGLLNDEVVARRAMSKVKNVVSSWGANDGDKDGGEGSLGAPAEMVNADEQSF